ncbi:Uncharacterised protein [Streptococcus pneumoniae]|nr:Uncharacterised protein [Streptococcus pneumoniae]
MLEHLDGRAGPAGGPRGAVVVHLRDRRAGAPAGPRRQHGLADVVVEAALVHPRVVEDLGEVAAARVGQHDHHDVLRAELAGGAQAGDDGQAGGAAHEQALLGGEAAGHGQGLGVLDGDDLVRDRGVVVVHPHVLADTLDEVGPAGAAGVHRAAGVRADHADRTGRAVRRDLLEVAAGARDGAARAGAHHDVGDAAGRVLPDLGAGGLVVGGRGGGVEELVGLIGPGDLPHEAVGDPVVGLLGRRVHGGGRDDELGAVRAEHVPLLLTHLVRGDEHGAVALEL